MTAARDGNAYPSGRASERNRLTLRTARSGRAKRKRKTAPDPDFKYTKDDVAAPPSADSAAGEPQDADDAIGEGAADG